MRRSNGGKEHATLHHSIEWPSVLRRSLATSVKGLSVKALLHTYSIVTHVQGCYTRSALLHTYRIATHVQHCYTRTALLHTYSIATHVQDCYTRTGLLHTYRIATHVQHCYTRTGLLHTYSIAILMKGTEVLTLGAGR